MLDGTGHKFGGFKAHDLITREAKGALLWDDGSLLQDHSDHGTSKELLNLLWTEIQRFY